MMKVAFDEIGRVAATFACEGGEVGKLCKMAADGKVALCAAGDDFIGMMESVRGGYAGVQIHGFAEVAYTGTAPNLGYTKLVSNGNGGVKTGDNGRAHLVVCVDENAMKAIVEL